MDLNELVNTFFNIFKGAGNDDDQAMAKAQIAAQHPGANDAVAPFDVSTSDNTATQNGAIQGSGEQPFQMSGGPPAPLPPITQPETPPSASSPATAPVTSAPSSPTPQGAVSPVAAPQFAPSTPVLSGSKDNDTRNAALADALKKRNMAAIPGAIAGAGDAINSGLAAFGINNPKDVQSKVLEKAKEGYEEQKGLTEEGISNDPNSDASKTARDLVVQIAPQMANDPNFATMSDKMLRDKVPLVDTMMKAKAAEDSKKLSTAQINSNKDIYLGLRRDQQQDKLEQNAKLMVSNLRGDKSLARTEEQRDAAAVAYNRLNEIQKSGKGMNPVDYADILGQIYKARTGTAPGEQIMRDIQQATAKGSLDKAYTYITGQQAPATTQAITDSLKSMALSMGKQADKFHEGYMKAHLVKPSGLDDDRWQPIATTARGDSFAKSTNQDAVQSTGNIPSNNDPMGLRS